MGVLGPKVIKVPSNASDDGSPPYKIVDNKLSPLSEADLVFIDPIGTGYSRAIGCHTVSYTHLTLPTKPFV